jgi:hypothetical protein
MRKDGYYDSKVICRQNEDYRHLDFRLIPLKTIITSEPEGAVIYWGSTENKLNETIHRTPRTEKSVSLGANWKDWYYQVKKKGYYDSEIVFKPQDSRDRYVHFKLKPYVRPKRKSNVSLEPKHPMSQNTVSGSQVTLTWQDSSSNELGFKIERKTGAEGTYQEIAKVGPNVTIYTDTELSRERTYYYRVRAYNSDGHSAYSEEIVVKTSAE